jgi:hypothetical protein
VQNANIEEWESHLAPITFRTKYLNLSIEEAKAFLEVTEAHREKREAGSEAGAVLDQVTQKMQAVIDTEPQWVIDGVFVKTRYQT